MGSSLQKVQDFLAEKPHLSRWPGAAVRISHGLRKGEIDFRKGEVLNVTDTAILVEMDHPSYRTVKLMGASYAHHCDACKTTIPGNVTYQRSTEALSHRGFLVPIRAFCPYCGPDAPLRMLRPGDKLRLHYRFEEDMSSASWFAEVWEW
jgi:hypothetical protein